MSDKVLFTASTFSHIRNFHLPYIRWFHEMGWKVHVACGGKAEDLELVDRTVELPFRKKMTSWDNLSATSILGKLIREEGYSLISTHTALAAFFTRLALKGMRNRPKLLNIVHGYLFDDNTPKLKRAVLYEAERVTIAQTDLLLTMNRWDYDFATTHHLGRRVEYIPGMGVDLTKYCGVTLEGGKAIRYERNIPDDAFVLIYPAEFSERKSQRVLIEAMAELPDNAYLLLPGDGVLLSQCRDLAARLEVDRRVVFPGQVGDMAPWYAASDAAVASSRSEGLPFNIVEAMHFALPVVASDVKGHSDLIRNGETGLLYPYGDHVACAKAIRLLMGHTALCQTLGRSANAASSKYSLTNVFPTVTALYSQLFDKEQALDAF